jgi:hypothetical protein
LSAVPAIVLERSATDAEIDGALTLVANTQRSPNPRAEYLAIDALVRRGMTTSQIADQLQLPITRIHRRYAIAQLRPGLLMLYREGRITHSTALAATHLDAEAQERCLTLYRASGVLRTQDVTTAIQMQQREQANLALEQPTRPETIVVGPSTEYVAEIEEQRERLRSENDRLRADLEGLRAQQYLGQIQGEVRGGERLRPVSPAPAPTATEARDVAARWIRAHITLPDGTLMTGRIQNGEFRLNVQSNSSGPQYDAMMRSIRALRAPQRTLLRQRILEIVGREFPQEWRDVIVALRHATLSIPMEDAQADAAYQHVMHAYFEIARMTDTEVER